MFQELSKAIEEENISEIKKLMEEHDLEIKDNKIVPKNPTDIKAQAEYWDTMQYIRRFCDISR